MCNLITASLSSTLRQQLQSDVVRQIEEAVRMKVGEEISIPLSLSDNDNLEPVKNVVTKAQNLVELSTKLVSRVSSFTQEMEAVKTVG